ncbi:MAG: hypothetical protein QM737_02920 [Ferruginibacter sp.]
MKKIFTLVLTVSLATAAFAQFPANREGNRNNNDVSYNDRWDRHDDNRFEKRGYYFKKREMERQIADINREYDQRICNVRDNWYMRAFKKQRIIRELEERRNCDINAVYAKFNYRNGRFYDDGPGRHW